MDLSKYFDEEKLVKSFKNSKNDFEKKQKQIEEYMKTNSSKEYEELELAFKKYNDKIEKITKTEEFKKMDKEILMSSEKMQKHLQTVIQIFDKKKSEIMKGGGTSEEKNKKVNKVYDYIISKLFSEEEVKLFKQMRNKFVYLIE